MLHNAVGMQLTQRWTPSLPPSLITPPLLKSPQFVSMLQFYTGQNVEVNVSRLQALVSKQASIAVF